MLGLFRHFDSDKAQAGPAPTKPSNPRLKTKGGPNGLPMEPLIRDRHLRKKPHRQERGGDSWAGFLLSRAGPGARPRDEEESTFQPCRARPALLSPCWGAPLGRHWRVTSQKSRSRHRGCRWERESAGCRYRSHQEAPLAEPRRAFAESGQASMLRLESTRPRNRADRRVAPLGSLFWATRLESSVGDRVPDETAPRANRRGFGCAALITCSPTVGWRSRRQALRNSG